MDYKKIVSLTQRRIRVASRREGAKEERNTDISAWSKYMKTAVSQNVEVEAVTGCAKHGNVLAEALAGKTEALAGYAKHGNVLAEALAGKTEAVTGCAKRIYHSQT